MGFGKLKRRGPSTLGNGGKPHVMEVHPDESGVWAERAHGGGGGVEGGGDADAHTRTRTNHIISRVFSPTTRSHPTHALLPGTLTHPARYHSG
jgi:hypothetical protein